MANLYIREVGHMFLGGGSNFSDHDTSGENASMPTSIENLGQAKTRFIETESYLKSKQLLQNKLVSVLYLHGMSGSGKSEIVRKLGEDFPYDQQAPFVKWHIECCDKKHEIKEQLAKLVKSMVEKGLLSTSNGIVQSATYSMEQGRCKEYIGLLTSSKLPILIVIEDPIEEEFLEDLLTSIESISDCKNKFHVYIASKTKTACLQPRTSTFHMQEVQGFTVKEGLELLGVTETCEENERDAAKHIIEKLSGFPLGLWAVKMARKPLTYIEYNNYLEKESHVLVQREKEKLGPKKILYLTVLHQLKPDKNNQDEQDVRHWQAICLLALLHHGNIPKILVERVMWCIREQSSETNLNDAEIREAKFKNATDSNDFIEKLSNCGFCKEEVTDQNEARVTFHVVVFGAVKCDLQYKKELQSAKERMVTCLAAIGHKDLRLTKNHEFMIDLLPHIQSTLDAVECDQENSTMPFCNAQPDDEKDQLMQFCYAHLHEVLGSVLGKQTSQASKAEKHLEKSMSIWFTIVERLNGEDFVYEPVATFVRDTTLKKAKLIVDHCSTAGRTLLSNAFDIEKFMSIVLQPRSNEVDFYGQKSNEEVKNYLQTSLEARHQLNPSKLRKFRDMNVPLFMERTRLYETFIAERIASVLHTMSLLIKSYRGNITQEIGKKCEDYSTLAVAISEEVHERFGVAPLFLLLSARGSVWVKLTAIKLTQGSERQKIVLETKRFIEQNHMEDRIQQTAFYEHGICKQISTNEFDYLRHQRQVTRINAKLLALGLGEYINVAEADQQCQSLYDKATCHKEWKISFRCLVYCGKYWASRGEYVKAVQHFEEALGCEGILGPSEATMSFPWACYNHARTVVCGKMIGRAKRSKNLCEQALEKKYISLDLRQNLEKSLNDLNEMIEASF